MNTNNYISSGIVESYVLGLATQEEREEFERECKLNPELVAMRDAFELMLEAQILDGSKQPPQQILAQLMPKIKQDTVPAAKVVSLSTVGIQNNAGQSKVVPLPASAMRNNAVLRRKNILRFLAAASVTAVMCSGYFLYRLQQQNSSLDLANKKLLAKYKNSDSTLNKLVNEHGGKGMAVVHLTKSTEPTQPQANIYWDSASATVYLVATNLPPLPQDKQYQLWAQIGGKPKNLGVFNAGDGKVILKMNNSKKADAFAITVEPKGGDSVPSGSVQAEGKP